MLKPRTYVQSIAADSKLLKHSKRCCFYVELTASRTLQSSSRTGGSIPKYQYLNDNGFSFFSHYHRFDAYRPTWLWVTWQVSCENCVTWQVSCENWATRQVSCENWVTRQVSCENCLPFASTCVPPMFLVVFVLLAFLCFLCCIFVVCLRSVFCGQYYLYFWIALRVSLTYGSYSSLSFSWNNKNI